jgi:hypothetical protein
MMRGERARWQAIEDDIQKRKRDAAEAASLSDFSIIESVVSYLFPLPPRPASPCWG